MSKTLNDFQNQLSESFHSKIYLLEKIIGDKHWLTSGTFKETVLISFLNQNLPKRYKAKSGFVIFPKQRIFIVKTPEDYDSMNRSSYIISKQIDILIYDNIESCPVFEDENIVLLAPEAVKGIIEVKGTLNSKHLEVAINLLIDYKNKWIEYKSFSEEHHIVEPLTVPTMYIYSWEFKKNKKGQRELTGKYIRNRLAKLLKENATSSNYKESPFINSVFVYNECEVSHTLSAEEVQKPSIGYMTTRGQSTVFTDDGKLIQEGDKTLFSLLRDILVSNNFLKNSFLLDTDDSNKYDLFPHRDIGYSKAFDV